MLLVCINRKSPAAAALVGNGVFTVNILAEHQSSIADTFAGRPSQGRPFDFDCAPWDIGASGTPGLIGAAARFDCALAEAIEGGTHLVAIGRVLDAAEADVAPLVYARRRYGRVQPLV